MKPQPTPKRPAGGRKMPKAQAEVIFQARDRKLRIFTTAPKGHFPVRIPGVWSPQPSLASARRRLKWERMSGEEKEKAMKRSINDWHRNRYGIALRPDPLDLLTMRILTLTGDLP